jgi:hypothetical protein
MQKYQYNDVGARQADPHNQDFDIDDWRKGGEHNWS